MSMKKRLCVIAAAVLLAVPAMGSVENASIEQASKNYLKLFDDARNAGERPGQGDMGDDVDKVMAKIPVDQMTLDQIQMTLNALPVMFSTTTSAAIDARLTKLSQGSDDQAARAAIYRLALITPEVKTEDQLKSLQVALAHPGIKAAVAKGYGTLLLATAATLSPDGLVAVEKSLVDLSDSIGPNSSVGFFDKGAALSLVVAKSVPAEIKGYAPLRQQLATALAEKLKGKVDPETEPRLQRALGQLTGPYASGTLVGSKAPAMTFDWFEDPTNPKKQIHSLDDLKGKVVVMDFWATWCGPCRATFPNVKALTRYYKGFDVVVLGVTSLQGFHVGPKGRIDTAGNPQKEYGLMADFIKEQGITWDIAFSKQPVFNPDYGVNGIPDVMIIDPAGIVRYAGLHPAAPLDEKIAMIDPLLGQAKLMLPATLMMSKPAPKD